MSIQKNANIEIITPKELIKNITKTNTNDDFDKYNNFFTNIDFKKHNNLYKKLVKDYGYNHYNLLLKLINSNKILNLKKYLFWKSNFEFQKEILEKITDGWDVNINKNEYSENEKKKISLLDNILFTFKIKSLDSLFEKEKDNLIKFIQNDKFINIFTDKNKLSDNTKNIFSLLKFYKEPIYQLLKSDNIDNFELAIEFLIETIKIDRSFIDIYEIISIINKKDNKYTNWLLKLFSSLIEYDYNFFNDNFLKHFYKLEINTSSYDMFKIVDKVWKKSLDNVFDMIFGNDTWFTEEKEKISTFIKDYESWSCLLSWYRWVWKSTLIKSIIEKLNKNSDNNTKYIPITINIPEQKKDENWISKSFSKKDLINKIIQQTYLKLKDNWFSSKQLEGLQDQYIRTFKQVEEISWYIKLKKRFWLIRTAIQVLKFSIPIGSWVVIQFILSNLNITLFWVKIENVISNPEPFQIIIAWILIFLNFLIFKNILSVNYDAKLERVLYNDDIAEDNFVKNLKKLSLISKYVNFFNKLSKNKKILSMIVIIFYLLFYFFINNINFIFSLIEQFILMFYYFFKTILDFSIEFTFLGNIILILIIIWILLLISLIIRTYFSGKKKFIIVIDELDKLLDFDKLNKNDNKDKISCMKDIFEILWKLKTLFFEAENVLFFVVSNKEAYDYYLSNKFQEDDMISNIFNKIIYLPMNDIKQFNLNFKIDIKPENDNDLKEKISKYLYFKSHGNWRKSNFILWNAIENTYKLWDKEMVRINLWNYDEFIVDYKFYEFFDKLYQVFERGSLDNINNKIFDNFLFSMSHKEKSYINKLLSITLDENWEEENVNSSSKFYLKYLLKLKEIKLIMNNKEELKIKEIDNLVEYISFIELKLNNLTESEFFWYFIISIKKISKEPAYKDFILNTLLNVYENIINFKEISIDNIFNNIKINQDNLEYPVFKDLIIFWLPLMLVYFNNIELYE